LCRKSPAKNLSNENVEKLFKPKPEKPWSQRFREITDRLAQGAKDDSQDDIDKIIDDSVGSVRKKSFARS
jgi:hypothetical protein